MIFKSDAVLINLFKTSVFIRASLNKENLFSFIVKEAEL